MLINTREGADIEHFDGFEAFIGYWNDMADIYKNNDKCNPNKKQKILIVFDDMIADMLSNKKTKSIVTEFFIRIRKLNASLVFFTQ